jgi:hypothetical protein
MVQVAAQVAVMKPVLTGPGPTNENTLNNSMNSCQIFILLKLLTNISDCVLMEQF